MIEMRWRKAESYYEMRDIAVAIGEADTLDSHIPFNGYMVLQYRERPGWDRKAAWGEEAYIESEWIDVPIGGE